MCQTINDNWGFGREDINFKSPSVLIEDLCACRRVGANYLLNISPTAQGGIEHSQAVLLELIGRWMAQYGESVYNGRPYTARSVGRNFLLKSADEKALYLFAFDLKRKDVPEALAEGKYADAYAFSGVRDRIKSIMWMDSGETLDFLQGEDMLGERSAVLNECFKQLINI